MIIENYFSTKENGIERHCMCLFKWRSNRWNNSWEFLVCLDSSFSFQRKWEERMINFLYSMESLAFLTRVECIWWLHCSRALPTKLGDMKIIATFLTYFHFLGIRNPWNPFDLHQKLTHFHTLTTFHSNSQYSVKISELQSRIILELALLLRPRLFRHATKNNLQIGSSTANNALYCPANRRRRKNG